MTSAPTRAAECGFERNAKRRNTRQDHDEKRRYGSDIAKGSEIEPRLARRVLGDSDEQARRRSQPSRRGPSSARHRCGVRACTTLPMRRTCRALRIGIRSTTRGASRRNRRRSRRKSSTSPNRPRAAAWTFRAIRRRRTSRAPPCPARSNERREGGGMEAWRQTRTRRRGRPTTWRFGSMGRRRARASSADRAEESGSMPSRTKLAPSTNDNRRMPD